MPAASVSLIREEEAKHFLSVVYFEFKKWGNVRGSGGGSPPAGSRCLLTSEKIAKFAQIAENVVGRRPRGGSQMPPLLNTPLFPMESYLIYVDRSIVCRIYKQKFTHTHTHTYIRGTKKTDHMVAYR